MNRAKPGASACFWVKGGAGVLVGRSINCGRWAIGGGGKEESGERVLVLLLLIMLIMRYALDLKQRESERGDLASVCMCSPEMENRHLKNEKVDTGFDQNDELMHRTHTNV